MTAPIFFDTDCLSSFLGAEREDILTRLYVGRIFVPEAVYDELSNPVVRHLAKRIECLEWEDRLEIKRIYPGTPEYKLYSSLAIPPTENRILIGKGEASAIALAKFNNGIVASNNLRDVKAFIDEYSLGHLTTGMILAEAFGKNLISEDEGNRIWAEMMRRRLRLPWSSFSEYLTNYP